MKRKKGAQAFRKRAAGAAVNSSVLLTIRDTLQSGDYPGALAAINLALVGVNDIGQQSKLLALAGDCLFKQGRFSEAADTYAHICQLVQNHPLLWLRPAMGQIYSLLKDVQVEAAKTQALAVMATAQTTYQQYQTDLVVAQATVAAGGQVIIPAEPPQPAKVASRLGKVFFTEGEPVTAKTLFQQALQFNPANCQAFLGLAEIALRENNPAEAILKARQALALNHYHAETLSAWPILLAAGRKSGNDVLDASLLNNLSQSPPAVRARAVLLLVKNLRGQGDARWQGLATNWLQQSGTTNKIIAAELRKLTLADARLKNASPTQRRSAAQTLLQTQGISPTEWLAATKEVVAASLVLNQAPAINGLITQGVSSFGVKQRPVFIHGIALACQKAGHADLAVPLFQRNAADANASVSDIGKSLWALARLQSSQGDHAGAAQSYWNYSQNTAMPQRFHLYALVQWIKELAATNQPDLLTQARPQLETAIAQITDYELVLDLSRQLLFSPLGRDFARQVFQRGQQLALQAFDTCGHPTPAATILFKFCRRASGDFWNLNATLATWSRLSAEKRQWLWSEQQDYWNYLELVFRAYRDNKQVDEAEQFIAPLLNDPATPPHGYAILGISYAILKRKQKDFSAMFSIYEQVAQVAPTQECTSSSYYWLALRAWKQGDATKACTFADRLLLALGNDWKLYWKHDYAAAAFCLKAGLDITQIPPQTNFLVKELQNQLKTVQADLATLNA